MKLLQEEIIKNGKVSSYITEKEKIVEKLS